MELLLQLRLPLSVTWTPLVVSEHRPCRQILRMGRPATTSQGCSDLQNLRISKHTACTCVVHANVLHACVLLTDMTNLAHRLLQIRQVYDLPYPWICPYQAEVITAAVAGPHHLAIA